MRQIACALTSMQHCVAGAPGYTHFPVQRRVSVRPEHERVHADREDQRADYECCWRYQGLAPHWPLCPHLQGSGGPDSVMLPFLT